MASSSVIVAEENSPNEDVGESNGTVYIDESCDDAGEWEDVTELLASAASELRVGEMIHPQHFSLYSAMSAIELMQPKMDVGFGVVRDVKDVEIPDTLSDNDVIRIMDELLACQATWMEAHTLPQTVFSCVYAQRLDEVPRPELAAFIRVQLASMSLVRALVTSEQVSDEEDFVSYNFGFKLPALSEPTVAKVVRDATSLLMDGATSGGSSSAASIATKHLLCARLKFIQLFHTTLGALAAPKCKRASQAEIAIELAAAQLKVIEKTWSQFPDDTIAHCFDSTFNRHMLSNAPPRTAPILGCEGAFLVWSKLLDQLRALTVLKNRILPKARRRRIGVSSPGNDGAARADKGSSDASEEFTPFFSFHTLCHGLSEFSATWNPCVVTRSLLKRMLLPSLRGKVCLYSSDDAPLADLLLGDIGLTRDAASEAWRKQADDLTSAAAHIIWNLLRNRGRQRRCLLHSLVEWDRSVVIFLAESSDAKRDASAKSSAEGVDRDVMKKPAESASPPLDRNLPLPRSESKQRQRARDMFAGKSPLQLSAHEVLTRVMMQHWLLGFECNLYNPREYAPMYFYVGYVMTTAANATAALANAGLHNAELHPCRYALYLLDEARLWLCRGTFSLLEALELGPHWNYTWRRRRRRWVPPLNEDGVDISLPNERSAVKETIELTSDDADDQAVFESEALWYQQRFGVMSGLSTGPQYMDYQTFLSLMDLQRDALLRGKAAGSDEIDVRLADASGGYNMVRNALKRARAVAEDYNWEPILDESLALTRVAVSNLVAINQLQKSGAAMKNSTEKHAGDVKLANVSFSFAAHRHFPVVKIA